jgi:hypothetical protein
MLLFLTLPRLLFLLEDDRKNIVVDDGEDTVHEPRHVLFAEWDGLVTPNNGASGWLVRL